MREHLGGVLRTYNGENGSGGDPLYPKEQLGTPKLLEVLETSKGGNCGFWGLPVKQLLVMGTACPQGGIWVGVLRSPMEELSVLRTPQWSSWECWGSQREELRIAGTPPTPPPHPRGSSSGYWGPLREEMAVLGTALPVK